MYKVFFECANILSTIAQIMPFCVPPPIDFGHFGLIFAKKVRIRSKKCTKCAVRNVDIFFVVAVIFCNIMHSMVINRVLNSHFSSEIF